jgi:hypothetical protein
VQHGSSGALILTGLAASRAKTFSSASAIFHSQVVWLNLDQSISKDALTRENYRSFTRGGVRSFRNL